MNMKEIINRAEKKDYEINKIDEIINKVDEIINKVEDNFIILSNLTLLSKVQKYEKLNIKKIPNKNDINFEIQIDNSYLPSIKRFFNGNDRDKTIEYVNKLINYGIEKYNEEKEKDNKIRMNKIASLLESSKLGLSNLKITYNTDQSITSKIDIIIDTIDVFRINIHSI